MKTETSKATGTRKKAKKFSSEKKKPVIYKNAAIGLDEAYGKEPRRELKRETVNLIPLREEVPIGGLFQFIGKKNVYRVVEGKCEKDGGFSLQCDKCALHDRKKEDQCASSVCTPAYRKDKKYVYFVKVE